MNNLTPDQKKRAVTEFSALEKQLDEVLFARNPYDEDDEDDRFPWLRTGATVGAGVGGAYGLNKLVQKGKAINAMPTAQPGLKPAGFLKNLKTGATATGSQAREGLMSLWKRLFRSVPK